MLLKITHLNFLTLKNHPIMFVLAILCLLFSFNLINVFTESGLTFYRDLRFWVTLVSLALLGSITIYGYAS
jgi:hypothetical protein